MKIHHRLIQGPLAAAITALCTAGPAQAVNLTLVDLGFLPGGGLSSFATGINDAGQVVGSSDATGGNRAFIWQNGVMTSLGVLGGTPFGVAGDSRATGINASGQVVGSSSNVFGTRGFVWQGGNFTDLGVLPGHDVSGAQAINASGQVVGISYKAGSGIASAFLWQGGSLSNLGDFSGGNGTSKATGINAAGTVVGNSTAIIGARGFVWQGGVMSALSPLPDGLASYAAGINSSGQVVGQSGLGYSNGSRATRWENGVVSSLGVLGSVPGQQGESFANAINDAGQVVGSSTTSLGNSSLANSAFLWSSASGMIDVNALLIPGAGARVLSANAINDNGQIAGSALFASSFHAVLLNPSGTLAWTGAGTSNGQGSFADGRNWELGFRPSALVEVLIAPGSSTTVLGPTGDMAAKTLTLGGAGSGPVTLQLQRGRITLDGGSGLAMIEANATLGGTGTFAGALVNRGSIAVSQLAVSQGVFNQAGGRIEGGRIATPYGVFNDGLISGSVRLDAAVENHGNHATTGLRVGAGEHMTMTGLINDGRVEVLGGALSNSGTTVNAAAGSFQLRNAVLRTDQGFANRGQINVSFGTSDIFGPLTNQSGGKVMLSGNSNTTFYDAVEVQSGAERRVSAGSTAVFFGPVLQRTGAVFSGAGAKFYEGGLSVGASPGLGLDAGSVTFGAGNLYLAEIGGLAAGTQFDQYRVAGTLGFGGTLKLVAWNGFAAAAGQHFDLFDWGTTIGHFDQIDLAGLQLSPGLMIDTTRLYLDGSIGVTAVPEPASAALLLGGLAALGARRRHAGAQRQRGRRLARPAALALPALLALLSSGAQAQLSSWTNPATGDWFDLNNWRPLPVPRSWSRAEVANGGRAVINSPGAVASLLLITGGGPGSAGSFVDVSAAGTLALSGRLAVQQGVMQILDGAQVVLYPAAGTGSTTEIGNGGSGQLSVKGAGAYLFAGATLLGDNGGTGLLAIASGGRVDSGYVEAIGGGARVDGAASLWTVSSSASFRGNALLSVANGGTAKLHDALVKDARISVLGAGSSLSTSSAMVVGVAATGTLGVHGGGVVTSATGTVGADSGLARGEVNIGGGGSAWLNSGRLVVGGNSNDNDTGRVYGRGTVNVSDGGLLGSATSVLGNQAGYFGRVVVDGSGSRWQQSGDLVVGNLGTGEVEISGGGQLGSHRGHVGFQAGANGSVQVSGAGSSWLATGSLFIGNAGSGVLRVLSGAVVSTAGNSYLGFAPGSLGEATVSGPGSTWNTLSAGTNLNIGGNQANAGGSGFLDIRDGGTVNTLATHLYSTGTLGLSDGATLTGHLTSYGGMVRSRGHTTLVDAITLGVGGIAIEPLTLATMSVFSGNIDGPGGLRKSSFAGITGSGTVVLNGNNSYQGPTTVDAGTLLINGSQASAVGVNAGVLGGAGKLLATVRVGDGVGGVGDSVIAPGQGPGMLGTLITGGLTINADGRYAFEINSLAAQADHLLVMGAVTLQPGAGFSVTDLGAGGLAPGTAFVAIDNDGVDAIVGEFAGLAEGQTFMLGANVYQVSYLAGTGNDLVLTVLSSVPEPQTWALALAGLALLGGTRRRAARAVHSTRPTTSTTSTISTGRTS